MINNFNLSLSHADFIFCTLGSSEITPPALSVIGEATPVSLEPWAFIKINNSYSSQSLSSVQVYSPSFTHFRRINIGSQYQAEIPELLDGTLALKDQHKATLVWLPNSKADSTPSQDTRRNLSLDCIDLAEVYQLHITQTYVSHTSIPIIFQLMTWWTWSAPVSCMEEEPTQN